MEGYIMSTGIELAFVNCFHASVKMPMSARKGELPGCITLRDA